MNANTPTANVEKSAGNNTDQQPRRLNSQALFEGQTQVVIEHEGQDYLLRLTRQGKLILTK